MTDSKETGADKCTCYDGQPFACFRCALRFKKAAAIASKYAPGASYAWFVLIGRELAAPNTVDESEALRIGEASTRGAYYGDWSNRNPSSSNGDPNDQQ